MKKNLLLLVLGISLNATAQMYIDTTCVSLNTLDEQPVYMVTQKKSGVSKRTRFIVEIFGNINQIFSRNRI